MPPCAAVGSWRCARALQALRTLLLRRMGRADQPWHELMQIVPHGTRILGAVNVTGPIERGELELELGRLDEARSSFDEAAGALWAAHDPQWVAASLEGQAAAALRCDAMRCSAGSRTTALPGRRHPSRRASSFQPPLRRSRPATTGSEGPAEVTLDQPGGPRDGLQSWAGSAALRRRRKHLKDLSPRAGQHAGQ